MSQAFHQRLPKHQARLSPTSVRVESANKSPLGVLGCCEVEVRVGSHVVSEQCIVVRQLNTSFILGLSAQEKLRLSLHPAERKVCIAQDEFVTQQRARQGRGARVDQVEVNPGLTQNQQRELTELMSSYKDVLVKEMELRAPVRGVQHEIELEPGTRPIALPVRRFSPREVELLQKQVEELKSKKVIRESNNPWCARALLVPKKDGTTRMVIDYTALINRTIKV